MRHIFSLLSLLLVAEYVAAEEREPQFAITYNVLETVGFIGVNKIFVAREEPKLIYLPFHLDAQMRLSDAMGISFGVVYRYENYQDTGPLLSDSGKVRAKKIWTNFHEVFVLAGPRFSIGDTGLNGFYFAMKGGVGTAVSTEYFNLSLLAQPEIGYAFSFGQPGFRLELGLGVLANLPFYENIDFAVPWKSNRQPYTLMGVLVHQAIPILNVGVGVNW